MINLKSIQTRERKSERKCSETLFYSFHGTFLSFHGTSQYPSPVTTQGNLKNIQSKLISLTLNILFVTLQFACIHIPFYQHEHKYPNISVSRETNKKNSWCTFPWDLWNISVLCIIYFWWSTHQILQITKQFYIP